MHGVTLDTIADAFVIRDEDCLAHTLEGVSSQAKLCWCLSDDGVVEGE